MHLAPLIGREAELAALECVLATSREPLHLAGEGAWPVPPLSLPEPADTQSLEGLLRSEAIRLFVDRARRALPAFTLSYEEVVVLTGICQKLDGLPLAIEFAVAWVTVLPANQIAERLADRLRLLTGRDRTAPARHVTLRATLDWSHELLSLPEQVLFRRLAAFRGSFDLEAVEAIGSGSPLDPSDILALLGQLTDKSLVVVEHPEGGPPRYRLLEIDLGGAQP